MSPSSLPSSPSSARRRSHTATPSAEPSEQFQRQIPYKYTVDKNAVVYGPGMVEVKDGAGEESQATVIEHNGSPVAGGSSISLGSRGTQATAAATPPSPPSPSPQPPLSTAATSSRRTPDSPTNSGHSTLPGGTILHGGYTLWVLGSWAAEPPSQWAPGGKARLANSGGFGRAPGPASLRWRRWARGREPATGRPGGGGAATTATAVAAAAAATATVTTTYKSVAVPVFALLFFLIFKIVRTPTSFVSVFVLCLSLSCVSLDI
ncbi:Uu.00g128160.m01.CDS01 [Anthostomella pinea]|uniref:Uu.00g128160.m01.CDS01 n=1 Tax=Anthostomella pinea TaxID=933095 RepID=A0AAI8VCY4_9PEZI|nr:Uu.00g128160.m01.CDS01 [Anthostomella pinea]